MAGRIRIRGSLTEVIHALSRSSAANPSRWERATAFVARANDVTAARRNVEHHYDLGNDFYSLWLDPDMVYTCAYYADEAMSLDEAQKAKLDLVCRKLQLRPDETVVEAGCGWGALALHMARQLRRARAGVQPVGRTAAVGARPRQARGARRPRRVHRRRLPQRRRAVRRVRVRRHARARGPAVVRRAGRRPAPHGEAVRRARPPALHRPRRAAAAERVDPPAHLSWRLRTDACRSGPRRRRARRHVGRRRREPAAALRAHARALERTVRRREGTRPRRSRAKSSAAHGSCISPARKRRSGPGGCSCSRWSSRRGSRRRPSSPALRSTPAARHAHDPRATRSSSAAGRPDRRARARLGDAGWNVVVVDRAQFPRDKVCAGWLTADVFPLLDLTPEEYRASGATLQEITGIPHTGDRPAADRNPLSADDQLCHSPVRVRRLSAPPLGRAPVRQHPGLVMAGARGAGVAS